jgi:hypothetical protein
MVTQCANPACRAPLRYLRDGRLFQFEVRAVGPGKVPPQHQVSHFWLCGQCSLTMTLTFDNTRGVMAIPLQSANENSARQISEP